MCRYTLKIIKFPLENIVPSKELFKKIGYEQPKARRNEEGQQRTAKFKGGFGFGKVCDTAGTGLACDIRAALLLCVCLGLAV